MSQHDFNIINASGLAVRTDLNNALPALASLSSGAVDPSNTVANGGVGVTYPFQLWVDTSGSFPMLRIRNAANTGWILLGRADLASFGFSTLQVGTAVASPVPYQLWVDTTTVGQAGGAPILRVRSGDNTSWIQVGDVSQTNLGLLALTGGTLSGALKSSNTDYWLIPVGTTAQRPSTPAAGMIRFNSTLGAFEGYKNGAWAPLGGGGGGGSLQWNEGDLAPTPAIDTAGNRIFNFTSGQAQQLFTSFKVPASYTAGSPISLYASFYSIDSSGTVQFQTLATLVRPGTTQFNSAANQRISSNGAVTLAAGTVAVPQMVQFDLTDSTGKINGTAVAPGDIVNVLIQRLAGDTAPSDAAFVAYAAELTFS